MSADPRKIAALLALVGALQGCGEGKDAGTDPASTRITKGVAVDPYISGAVLQELRPDGTVVQESSPSDASGLFVFGATLRRGNVVAMLLKGQHNGVPYGVALRRRVDVGDGTLVVSPLTTLMADGTMTAEQVAALVNAASPGATVAASDVTADPMARMLDGEITSNDRALLAGAIAASAALEIERGNATSAALQALVNAVAPAVADALAASGAPGAVANAAAAVADYLADSSTDPAAVEANAAGVTPELLGQLVAAAAGGGGVSIVVGAGGVLTTEATAGTVAEHLSKGRAALEGALSSHSTDQFLEAVSRFSAAAAAIPSDVTATTAQKDEARFFGALARVAALADPYSDFVPDNGISDLGDLLDGFGLGGTTAQRANLDTLDVLNCATTCSSPAPGVQICEQQCTLRAPAAGSPRSGAIQAFLFQNLAGGLDAAALLLEDVTEGFHATLNDGARVIELDFADARALEAVARGLQALLFVQRAYDLDVDIGALASAPAGYGPSAFLAEHPEFLKLKEAARLPEARVHALEALAAAEAALASMKAETDDPSDDLLTISSQSCGQDPVTFVLSCATTYNDPSRIASAEAALSGAREFLEAPGEITFDMGTPGDTSDDVVILPARFFSGIDLRVKLPTFVAPAGEERPGVFPDPTFGGLLVQLPGDLNADLDGDGASDLFGGFTRFPADFFTNATLDAWGWESGTVSFGAAPGPFTFTQSYGASETVTGAYTTSGNVLTLAFDTALASSGVKRIVMTADRIEYGYVSGFVQYFDEGGVELSGSMGYSAWWMW